MPGDDAPRRPTPRSSARAGRSSRGAPSRRATGPGCCAGSPPWSTRTCEELAQLEVRNSGHTIGNARWEAGNVRDVLDYYAGAPERLTGRQIPVAGGLDVTFHEPLGVVGVIVPWNFPMPIAGWGFAPGAGRRQHGRAQAGRADPADRDPARRAGAGGRPAGGRVHRRCPGKGSVVGERFVTHPAVRKVCFTGSTEVGKRIMAGCADQVKRVTLELGGKSANIVFADADLAKAAAAAPCGGLRQRRPGLLRAVPDPGPALGVRPVPGAAGAGGRRRSGCEDPALETRRDGPADLRRAARHGGVLRRRRRRWRSPARAPDGAGFWYPPTVLLADSTGRPALARGDLRAGACRCCRSTTRPTRSGWPTTPSTACPARSGPATWAGRIRVSRGVETGNLSVNSHSSVRYWTPFGGMKQSGLGRELGPGRAARVHRRQERLHQRRRSWRTAVDRLAGPGRGDHRRRQRHRAGHRAAVRRRGRARGRASTSTPTPARPRPTRSAASSSPATWPTRRRCATCSTASPSGTAGSTSRSTTPASRRPTTTRSWTPAWTPGSGCCEVNTTSVYLCCKYAIPHMQRQGKGSIINTASFVALMGAATSQIAYTASKGGVLAMTRELGVQFAREGIRVNALCPGPGRHAAAAWSCSPRTRSGPPAGWCTCRWAGSPSRRRSPPRSRSWPATTRRS